MFEIINQLIGVKKILETHGFFLGLSLLSRGAPGAAQMPRSTALLPRPRPCCWKSTVPRRMVGMVEYDVPSGKLYNITMENTTFIVNFPIENGDFP